MSEPEDALTCQGCGCANAEVRHFPASGDVCHAWKEECIAALKTERATLRAAVERVRVLADMREQQGTYIAPQTLRAALDGAS